MKPMICRVLAAAALAWPFLSASACTNCVMSRLRSVAASPNYYWGWTHPWVNPWPAGGDTNLVVAKDGRWQPKPTSDVRLASGYEKYADGHRTLIAFADFASIVGTWHSERYYAVNRAALTAAIRRHWQELGGITVFSWHMDHPYCTTGFASASYRFKSTGEDRNVVRQILDGTGRQCGLGSLGGETNRVGFANPRAWYLAQLGDIANFLNGLTDERTGAKIPVVVRFPHECDGTWFWWGRTWCRAADFRALCRLEAETLRKSCPNQLLFAYTPDKTWWNFGREGGEGNDFLSYYPGDDVTDILGLDDYSIGNGDDRQVEANFNATVRRLRLMCDFGAARGKVVCVSETGGDRKRDDFWAWLHRVMTAPGVTCAFANVWRGGWGMVPATAASQDDELAFSRRPEVLLGGKCATAGFARCQPTGDAARQILQNFRAPAGQVGRAAEGIVFVEAEGFSSYGGWALDTQFVHKMGSAYLISKGVLSPCAPATTRVALPRAGTWHAWVRTKDWLPEFSPGRFALSVGGRQSRDLGVSGRAGWLWERAGAYDLAAGEVELSLVDLSGGFARCDAVLLSADAAYVPPDGARELADERSRFYAREKNASDGGSYEVVVVGAGPGGFAAAVAAARNGARTLLVHDRPVLGGNSSIEQHTNIGGASSWNRSRGELDMREGGIVEESRLLRFAEGGLSTSEAYRRIAAGEPNLTVRANERVVSATRAGNRIVAVESVNALTGARRRYSGTAFVDGTGDGWLGLFVGAEMMYGREARAAYGESDAPPKADSLTMSGSLDDYVFHRVGREVPFVRQPWFKVLPENFNRPDVNGLQSRWWLEHPGTFDDMADPERARDELIRINLDYWAWLRRHPKFGDQARSCSLDEIKIHNGRREGGRIRGDYVLTSTDCAAGRRFPDAVAYGGWGLDLHDPKGVMNPSGNGWWSNRPTGHYQIPYRCLYSRNIENLFMAGRDVSVSHAALGSVRIMGTLFTLGQAAGTAAQMAAAAGLTAREIGTTRIRELQQRLIRDDLYIPGVKHDDPGDLARRAKVSASSTAQWVTYGRNDPEFGGADRYCDRRMWLSKSGWSCFPRGTLDRLEAVACYLDNRGAVGRPLTLEVYESDAMEGAAASRRRLGGATAVLADRGAAFLEFRLTNSLAVARRFVWLRLSGPSGVTWIQRQHVFTEGGCCATGPAEGPLQIDKFNQVAFVTTPVRATFVDSRPEYVVDGFARRDSSVLDGTCTHAWRADPNESLPQWIELDFPSPVEAGEVRVTFDSGLVYEVPTFGELVRDYAIMVKVGREWSQVALVRENYRRLAVHRFPRRQISALRIRIDATWGHEPRIQEVRVYGSPQGRQ